MRTHLPCLCLALVLASFAAGSAQGQSFQQDPLQVPVLREFVGSGFGRLADSAPELTRQFGRLVGVWHAEEEVRRRDGSWMQAPSATWVWKYAPGGFAVQDLWYQGKDNLPVYLGDLGHDYLLMATRIYDPVEGKWQIAWAANSGGRGPGADFGTFEATRNEDRIVMMSPGTATSPPQRITFHDFTEEAFRWTSEISFDNGETWQPVTRVVATRKR